MIQERTRLQLLGDGLVRKRVAPGDVLLVGDKNRLVGCTVEQVEDALGRRLVRALEGADDLRQDPHSAWSGATESPLLRLTMSNLTNLPCDACGQAPLQLPLFSLGEDCASSVHL